MPAFKRDSDTAINLHNVSLRALATSGHVSFNLEHLEVSHLHGTSSASLIDLLQTGLVPTGRQKEVSFSGEMMGGILPSSLNHSAVSVVGCDAVISAASYAEKNLMGWDPSRSAHLMELAEYWMRQGGSSEEVIAQWRPIRQQIECERVARWERLTEEEQSLIRTPFPVVCGIHSSVETFDTATSVLGEKGIESARPEEFSLFVPEEHLVAVLELKLKYNSSCIIRPLSLLTLARLGRLE